MSPPLTAMRAPAEQLGKEAASLLVDQIDGDQSSAPRKIYVPEALVIRKSTGPVRAR
jgi:DNA-binding LacI/PurR family transcriptional regulator